MRIVVDRCDGLERAALLDETGDVIGFYVDRYGGGSLYGGVYVGRVRRLLSGDSGVFIDIGQGEDVWMGSQGIRRERRRGGSLRPGDLVVVQVYAEATEDKAARVDVDIRLVGRYSVFLPYGEGVKYSRRCVVGGEVMDLRQQLEMLGYGWIIRSSGVKVGIDVSMSEARDLVIQWEKCTSEGLTWGPRQLLAPYSVVRCALMDAGTDIEEILVDGQEQFEVLRRWVLDSGTKDLLSLLRLSGEGVSVFERFGLEEVYGSRVMRRLGLYSGGEIVIERTEVCVVIDINNGKVYDKMSVNLEAVEEITRQLRFRNIQGMIVIDFLRVGGEDRRRLVERLEECLQKDVVHTEIYGWTRLGLFEMKRTIHSRGL